MKMRDGSCVKTTAGDFRVVIGRPFSWIVGDQRAMDT